MNLGWFIAWIWLFAVIVLMILRGVPTPPGRPDDVDFTLIAVVPIVCAGIAIFSRSWLSVWCVILITTIGAWFAWLNNSRLKLDLAFNGWERHVRWWIEILVWMLIGGRAAAGITWFYRDKLIARRATSGLCPTCGYDLRATPNRCPECGHLGSDMSA